MRLRRPPSPAKPLGTLPRLLTFFPIRTALPAGFSAELIVQKGLESCCDGSSRPGGPPLKNDRMTSGTFHPFGARSLALLTFLLGPLRHLSQMTTKSGRHPPSSGASKSAWDCSPPTSGNGRPKLIVLATGKGPTSVRGTQSASEVASCPSQGHNLAHFRHGHVRNLRSLTNNHGEIRTGRRALTSFRQRTLGDFPRVSRASRPSRPQG